MELSKTIYEGFVITGDPQFPALKHIRCEGKGSVPKLLRGKYTSIKAAKDDIIRVLYAISRIEKEAADKGKAVDAARKLAAKTKAALKKEIKEREADAAKDNTASRSKSVRQGTDNGSVAA